MSENWFGFRRAGFGVTVTALGIATAGCIGTAAATGDEATKPLSVKVATSAVASPAAAMPAAAATPGVPGGISSEQPPVKLIDSGAEPRRKLAMKLGAGSSHVVDPIIEMGVRFAVDADVVLNSTDSMHVTLRSTVGSTDADAAVSAIEIVEARLLAGAEDSLSTIADTSSLLKRMRGKVMSRTAAPAGNLLRPHTPPAWDPEIGVRNRLELVQSVLDGSAVTFPDGEIGIGARWTVHAPMHVAGMAVPSTGEFTLTGLSDREATIQFSSRGSISAKSIVFSEGEQPATIDAVGIVQSISGQLLVRFDQPLPVGGTVTIQQDVKVSMTTGPEAKAVTSLPTRTIVTRFAEPSEAVGATAKPAKR